VLTISTRDIDVGVHGIQSESLYRVGGVCSARSTPRIDGRLDVVGHGFRNPIRAEEDEPVGKPGRQLRRRSDGSTAGRPAQTGTMFTRLQRHGGAR
jgi:hypothetical protein